MKALLLCNFLLCIFTTPLRAGTWNFDKWLKSHANQKPKISASQSGEAELEPLLPSNAEGRNLRFWRERRRKIKETLLEILGPFPASRPPMKSRVIKESDEGNYIRRKVYYAGEAGEMIPAYLFLPKRIARPTPAIICLHQTKVVGKLEASGLIGDRSLAFAPQLAERGYITIAPDAICFGERYKAGRPYKHYGDAVEFYEAHPNWSIMGKMVWDVGRAIDYLCTLREVDPKRIGCIGHSHGGYGTIFAMALDERIKVGVSSCGFGSFRADPKFERWYRLTALMPRLGFYEGHVDATPLDFHHILSLIAPRPFFNSSAFDDGVFPGTKDLKDIMDEVRNIYNLYGKAERFDYCLFTGGHHFPPTARDRAYAFFERWLGK